MNYAYDNFKTRTRMFAYIHRLYRKKTAREELRMKEEKNEEMWGEEKAEQDKNAMGGETGQEWEEKQGEKVEEGKRERGTEHGKKGRKTDREWRTAKVGFRPPKRRLY